LPLNKQKGNMYPWITHTWNPIRGKCPHDCSYCYMKRIWNMQKEQGINTDLHLEEKELETNLGKGNTIFVGSSTDMFCEKVSSSWIQKTINHMRKYPKNQYIFQTKDTAYFDFLLGYILIPSELKITLGSTIETNKNEILKTKAPKPYNRWFCLQGIKMPHFISIEPIMDFDLDIFLSWFKNIKLDFVSIGADSGHNNLPEPPAWKVKKLIEELKQFTEVRIKDNLTRLLEDG
jgi:DNA repair photolyase